MSTLFDTHAFSSPLPRAFGLVAGLVFLFMVGGCAKQKSDPNYYDPPQSGSETDASNQARSTYNRGVISAPSQIQLDLKREGSTGAAPAETPDADAVSTGRAAVVAQPQTYLGTLPCFHQALECTAQRITLTLAPNGRWRARVGYLHAAGQSGANVVDQGCWRAVLERRPRILLLEGRGNVRAELVMTQNNVLRVRTVNGDAPSLVYNLTRQPDLDPIDELSGASAPVCDP